MPLAIKTLDKKTIIKNIVKIVNISRISKWTYKNFILDLPGKWKKSIGVFDESKKEIVAYCIVSEKKDSLHIHLLMVSNKYQGLGLGSQMIKNISDDRNKKITVKTFTHLRRSIKFYKKNKFFIKNINTKTVFMEKRIKL